MRPAGRNNASAVADNARSALIRISQTPSGIAGNLLVAITCDGVELCERFRSRQFPNRESFSPSVFQLGEKVPKADEGAFHACVIVRDSCFQAPMGQRRKIVSDA